MSSYALRVCPQDRHKPERQRAGRRMQAVVSCRAQRQTLGLDSPGARVAVGARLRGMRGTIRVRARDWVAMVALVWVCANRALTERWTELHLLRRLRRLRKGCPPCANSCTLVHARTRSRTLA